MKFNVEILCGDGLGDGSRPNFVRCQLVLKNPGVASGKINLSQETRRTNDTRGKKVPKLIASSMRVRLRPKLVITPIQYYDTFPFSDDE